MNKISVKKNERKKKITIELKNFLVIDTHVLNTNEIK
jgi:hypothetical protein